MRKIVSLVSIAIYLFLIPAIFLFVKAIVGGYWSCYLFATLFSIPPILAGPRKFRIAGCILLFLGVLLAVADYIAGQEQESYVNRYMIEHHQTN